MKNMKIIFALIIFLSANFCDEPDENSKKNEREWQISELDEYFYTLGKSPINCENSRMKRIRLCFGNKLSDSRCLLLQTHVGITQYILTENTKTKKDSVLIGPLDSKEILQVFDDLKSKTDCPNNFIPSFVSFKESKGTTWSPYYAGSLEFCDKEKYCIQLFYTDSLHLIPETVKLIEEITSLKLPKIIEEL